MATFETFLFHRRDACRAPSKDYGRRFGIKIWREYALPDGMTYSSLEKQLESDRQGPKASEDLFQQIVELNSELNSLQFNQNSPYERGKILAGVASKFNIDDIQYFLNNEHYQFETADDARNSHRLKLGGWRAFHVDWVVSTETLAVMETEARQRYNPKHRFERLRNWARNITSDLLHGPN